MTLTISRWGNSLAVRLPKEALEQADLREGDVLEVSREGRAITLTLRGAPPTLDELIARIAPENLHAESFSLPAGAEPW